MSERISISTKSVSSLSMNVPGSGTASVSTTPPYGSGVSGLGSGPRMQLELDQAENGEIVHPEGGLHLLSSTTTPTIPVENAELTGSGSAVMMRGC